MEKLKANALEIIFVILFIGFLWFVLQIRSMEIVVVTRNIGAHSNIPIFTFETQDIADHYVEWFSFQKIQIPYSALHNVSESQWFVNLISQKVSIVHSLKKGQILTEKDFLNPY